MFIYQQNSIFKNTTTHTGLKFQFQSKFITKLTLKVFYFKELCSTTKYIILFEREISDLQNSLNSEFSARPEQSHALERCLWPF